MTLINNSEAGSDLTLLFYKGCQLLRRGPFELDASLPIAVCAALHTDVHSAMMHGLRSHFQTESRGDTC